MENFGTLKAQTAKPLKAWGKRGSKYNNGKEFKQSINGAFNTSKVPFGYNWALGYTERSAMYF